MSLLAGTAGASPPRAGAPAAKGFMLPNNVLQVDWDELLPPGTADHADTSPPPPQHNYLGEAAPAAKQTGSSAVNPDLHGLTLRIPGFIVPLDLDTAGRVLEFFLVPYYGACIHVPPPPPNQIVYVRASKSKTARTPTGLPDKCASNASAPTWLPPPIPWLPAKSNRTHEQ